jgi:hypothetical protein
VERDGLLWCVWCPALGKTVARCPQTVSGPKENGPLFVEDEGAVFRRNVGNNSPSGSASTF